MCWIKGVTTKRSAKEDLNFWPGKSEGYSGKYDAFCFFLKKKNKSKVHPKLTEEKKLLKLEQT